ncbi:MAG TPA: hypothetical protein VFH58_17245 [Acidimicrobiales bacterium]|nr:hypothetical protein [Acidimicrobiales bacterium]
MRHPHASLKTLAVAGLALAAWLSAFLATPTPARPSSVSPATLTAASGGSPGYWLVGSNGEVFQLGTTNYGDTRYVQLSRPMVGGSATPSGMGYWLVASDGGIFSYGDARFWGSTGGIRLNRPIVAMAADPVTGGYWMVASDGGVFAFNAPFYGSTGGITLNKPVVGIAPSPTGHGYWLVASDGGVFAFGDARFRGSTGGIQLAKPVVGISATPDGGGYWMAASDGGIFAFGNARFYGSTGSVRLNAPVVGMSATPSGGGYWLAASDGGVFSFGNAPYLGTSGTSGSPPIVAIMSTAHGYSLPPGATGYDVSQWQCSYYAPGASLPPAHPAIGIVQASGGAIDKYQPAQCYPLEAQWAGPNMSAYIYMDPLPSPGAPKSMSGPAGNCAPSDTNCQSYNYGYNWAATWVAYAHANNTHPTLWWLDVEVPAPGASGFSTAASAQPGNSRVIAGAVAGLKASGVTPGIYSTHLQWTEITGGQVSFPGIALWVPGASTVSDAQNMCTNPDADHAPFAGGRTILIQYGYGVSPPPQWDQDYACR